MRKIVGRPLPVKSALFVLLLAAASPVQACKVALALTIDVSGSIDPGEYQLQMDGLAAALEDATVADALVEARAQVTVVQWSGASRQDLTIPWRHLQSLGDVEALAEEVRNAKRPWRHFSTAIGEVLTIASGLFDDVQCSRKVIDVSGDGVSNEGPPPEDIQDRLAAAGIDVNALAILGTAAPGLEDYFREKVIVGPRSFVYSATGFEDYPRAIRRKLLDEVTEPVS